MSELTDTGRENTNSEVLHPDLAPTPQPLPCLLVVSSSTPGTIGTLFHLKRPEVVIGRSPDAHLRLVDDGVSRKHAKVSSNGVGQFHLTDLGSKNGTYVNGLRVDLATLNEGDQIQIGSSTLLKFSLRADLRESEERLRQALAVGRVGTWDWDEVQGRVTLGENLDKVLGIAKGPLTCTVDAFLALIHPADRDRFRQAVSRSLETGDPVSLECRTPWPDGTLHWVAAQGEVMKDAAGKGVRVMGTLVDHSARKKIEEQLQRQLRTFESLYDGGVVLDLQGRVLEWNESAEKMFGYCRAEMVNRLPFEALRVEKASEVFEAMFAELGRAGRWMHEATARRKDGSECACEVVTVPLRGDGDETVAYLSVYRDVTERKQLQARVLLADRMASMGTLAAGVAHEINNPLAYVMANLSFVSSELASILEASPKAEEVIRALQEAHEGTHRVSAIVRDLKTFSREPQASEDGRADLGQVLELAAKMAKNEIRHRAVLMQELDPLPPVRGSESRLGQVFLNLLVNAAHAIPEGNASRNQITVRARLAPDGRAVVEVHDTGSGIPPEAIKHIFDPFFTTKPVGTGTGLGLSICHTVVTALGGEITVESQPGRGSLFRVTLPLSADPGSETEAATPILARRGRGPRARVLVVDDEPLVGTSIGRVLGADHDVVAVASAKHALQLLRAGSRFDLILCDVMMPEMTGMDLSAAVSEIAPEQGERMVFMTGGAFTERARTFLEAPSRRSLLKPLNTPQLRLLVEDTVRPLGA